MPLPRAGMLKPGAFSADAESRARFGTNFWDKATADIAFSSSSIGSDKLVVVGDIDLLGNRITGSAAPSSPSDLATKAYIDAISLIVLHADGSVVATGALNMGGHGITQIADPVNPQDAATKRYVDGALQGLVIKAACTLATTGALPANTYNNGTLGVGATLTATAVGALSVDSTLTTTGMRVLVQNEGLGEHNGIYVVTQVGDGSTPYILTRASDFNTTSGSQPNIDPNSFTFITSGGVNATRGFVLSSPPPYTVGTTPLLFTQFSFAGGGGSPWLDNAGVVQLVTPSDSVLIQSGQISSRGSGTDSEVYGLNATALGNNSVALGNDAHADADRTVIIGQGADTDQVDTVAIGYEAYCGVTSLGSVAIGSGTGSHGLRNVFIGYQINPADDTTFQTVALGDSVSLGVSVQRAVALGSGVAVADGADDVVVIGASSTTDQRRVVNVGYNTNAHGTQAVYVGTGIGDDAGFPANNSVLIGDGVNASNAIANVVIGQGATSNGPNNTIVGQGTSSASGDSVLIGDGITSNGATDRSVCVGHQVTNGGASNIIIGPDAHVSGSTNNGAILIGDGVNSNTSVSIGIGGFVAANGFLSVAMGWEATTTSGGDHSVALGYRAQTYSQHPATHVQTDYSHTFLTGHIGGEINDVYFGAGVVSPQSSGRFQQRTGNYTIHGTNGQTWTQIADPNDPNSPNAITAVSTSTGDGTLNPGDTWGVAVSYRVKEASGETLMSNVVGVLIAGGGNAIAFGNFAAVFGLDSQIQDIAIYMEDNPGSGNLYMVADANPGSSDPINVGQGANPGAQVGYLGGVSQITSNTTASTGQGWNIALAGGYTDDVGQQGGDVQFYVGVNELDSRAGALVGFFSGVDGSLSVQSPSATTTIDSPSDGLSLPQDTIFVTDATNFSPFGALIVETDAGPQTVSYTSKSGSSVNGCSGGTGQMHQGNSVAGSVFGSERFGLTAHAYNLHDTVVGYGANTAQDFGTDSVAVGYLAFSEGTGNVVIGTNAQAFLCDEAVVIGFNAQSGRQRSVTIGSGISSSTIGGGAVTIGYDARNDFGDGIAIGNAAQIGNTDYPNVILGTNSSISAQSNTTNILIGPNNTTRGGDNGVFLIGDTLTNLDIDGVSVLSNVLMIGGNVSPIFDVYFGGGTSNTSFPTSSAALTIHGSGGGGVNPNGCDVRLAGGKGFNAGTDHGGNIGFFTARDGAAQTLVLAGFFNAPDGTFSVPGAGSNSERFGLNSLATGTNTTVVGNSAFGLGSDTTVVGCNVQEIAGSSQNVLIGSGVNTGASITQASVVVGFEASTANGSAFCVAIGSGAQANQNYTTALGYGASVGTSPFGVAIGAFATANGVDSIAIGSDTTSATVANGDYSVVIGGQAKDNGVTNTVVIGHLAQATGINSVAIGNGASAGAGEVSVLNGNFGFKISSTVAEGVTWGESAAANQSWWGAAPVSQATVSGSRGGNAALASLLTTLANYGLIVDATVA